MQIRNQGILAVFLGGGVLLFTFLFIAFYKRMVPNMINPYATATHRSTTEIELSESLLSSSGAVSIPAPQLLMREVLLRWIFVIASIFFFFWSFIPVHVWLLFDHSLLLCVAIWLLQALSPPQRNFAAQKYYMEKFKNHSNGADDMNSLD